MHCGSAPAVPCVGGGGCDQPCPLQPPPCPELKRPSRRAGGKWAGIEQSEECPAVTQAMPGDSHHLGVLIPPTKRTREREIETRGRRRKEAGRRIGGQMDRDKERSNETE